MMTLAIQPIAPSFLRAENINACSENIHKTASLSQGSSIEQQIVNFRPFLDRTEVIVEGGIWGAFWVGNIYFVAESLRELYKVFTIEHPLSEKFKRIGFAVKNAFVDIVSLVSSSAYLLSWSNTAKIISLGKYFSFVKSLCFKTSLVINMVEAAADIYTLWSEKEAILVEKLSAKREVHKQNFCCALMKLISNVSMVAWAAFGLASLAGVFITPMLASVFLIVGCVMGFAAISYKMHVSKSVPLSTTRSVANG